jgi:hypothetical protein
MGSSIDCSMRARYESERLALAALKPKKDNAIALIAPITK